MMRKSIRSRGRIAYLALGLYLGQLLLAPVLHQAVHASEALGQAPALASADEVLRAPCPLACADPTHHHGESADPDHAATCSTCTGLGAPAHVESKTSSASRADSVCTAGPCEHSPRSRLALAALPPRGPPTLL